METGGGGGGVAPAGLSARYLQIRPKQSRAPVAHRGVVMGESADATEHASASAAGSASLLHHVQWLQELQELPQALQEPVEQVQADLVEQGHWRVGGASRRVGGSAAVLTDSAGLKAYSHCNVSRRGRGEESGWGRE